MTLTDLVNNKISTDKAGLTSAMLNDLIKTDLSSDEKLRMAQGTAYYLSRHDILDFVRYYYVDGQAIREVGKSNERMPHPFHKILVDQKVSYIAGNPIVVGVKEGAEPKYGEAVNELLQERFVDVTLDWVKGASNKGFECVHFYVNTDGSLRFIVLPAEQCIPIWDTQYQETLVEFIRYYEYDLIATTPQGQAQRETLHKLEWWTATDVTYWVEYEKNNWKLDPFYTVNPSGHFHTFNTQTPGIKNQQSWGKVPFVVLWNNTEGKTDLEPIKPLIDAYDKVVSGWCNDLNDFAEMIFVLEGYQRLDKELQAGLSDLAAFMQNLKTLKAITVEPGGGVTTLKAEIPVEAKEKFLDITRRAIFYFGHGVDVESEKLGNASGVALKFVYTMLDMKANALITKLKASLKEFIWFVTEHLNRTEGKKFDPNDATFTINKSVIFNESEKIKSLVESKDILSEETILENHPYVSDVEAEMKRLEAQREKRKKEAAVNPPPLPTNGQQKEPVMN